MDIVDTLTLCYTCMACVEFDVPCEGDGTPQEAIDASYAALAALPGRLHASWEEWGEGHDEFSWHPCERCKSSLGGSRYRYVLLATPTQEQADV